MTSTTSKDYPRLLTTQEATEYLWNQSGRSASARLYRAYRDGRIQSKRLCGRHWWPLKTLREYAGYEATDD